MFISSLLLIISSLCVTGLMGQGSDSLIVVQTPSSLKVNYPCAPLKLSEFKSVVTLLSGFSVEKNIQWNCLTSTNALETPKAVLIIKADNSKFKAAEFSNNLISIESDTSDNFDYLKNYFDQTFGTSNSVHNYASLTDLTKVASVCNDNPTSVHVFDAPNVDQAAFPKAVDQLITSFSQECKKSVDHLLVFILTADEILSRERRAANTSKANLKQSTASAINNTISNEAVFYNDNYPAIFNILFWTTLAIALAVYGIAISMWHMDPGLDTVIYRMTSQRIKKDN